MGLLIALLGLSQDQTRSSDGLVILYTFEEGQGNAVKDRSVLSQKMDLEVKGDLQWRDGALQLKGRRSILRSATGSGKLFDALRKTNEALRMNNWIQKDAANFLGISSRVMNYKVQKFEITHERWTRNRVLDNLKLDRYGIDTKWAI